MNLITEVHGLINEQSLVKNFFARMHLPASRWLEDDKITVYIRVGGNGTPTGIKYCLTIANIIVRQEHRGNKYGTRFIKDLEKMAKDCGFDYLVVESLQNVWLAEKLERDGYTLVGDVIPTAYLKTKGE